MRIALFDYVVAPHTGPGSRDAELLQALRNEHEFTVLASRLTLPSQDSGDRIRHVAVRTIPRPAFPSFVLYFIGACLSYTALRLRGRRFELVHVTDASFPVGDVYYAHFCHRAYLREVWSSERARLGARTFNRWASHAVRALIEARLVRSARMLVVPSEGLGRDFARVYPEMRNRVTVIPNTVDVSDYRRPSGFDRRAFRERLNVAERDVVFAFVALGHFERKGLPVLLEALSADDPILEAARLWVVGGEHGLVASYRALAEQLGVADKVTFVGRTDDVRPFLWSADAFVLPSHYEAFSAALLEAAAAGLPAIATRVSGAEEVLEDGVNGFEVEITATGIGNGLRRFLELDPDSRAAMQRAASQMIAPMGPERFAAAWRELYASLEA